HAEGVADPGPQQVGPCHGDGDDGAAADVVADEVGGLAECLQLRDQPVPVGRHGPGEAVRDGRAEAGRGQAQDVGAVEAGAQRVPDRGALGVAVDEHGGHGAPEAQEGTSTVSTLTYLLCDTQVYLSRVRYAR